MDDLISRKQAIEVVQSRHMMLSKEKVLLINDLEKLPSAQPKSGHWIIYTVSPFDGEDVKCSECGRVACAPYWDYCPNCGARMDGVTE